MKHITGLLLLLTIGLASAGRAETLDRETQIDIIENYLYVTGRWDELSSQALADREGTIIKCGMSAVADFVLNRDKLDRDLLRSMNLQSDRRPVLEGTPESFDSPDGLFKIHYVRDGADSVYRPNEDVNSNGVPDFVEAVARICDSSYYYIMDTLGYPAPPSDGFYPSGGDSLYDVYLRDLGTGVYGLAYIDSVSVDGPGSIRATSFLELDRDYQDLTQYVTRPLDAVRVTVAHELFHAVQFGIDFTESEFYEILDDTLYARYWMEMSAVWMEEEQYDLINDYYNYLPYFFDDPRQSLQRFDRFSDLRPYAAGIFPIFLAEYYNRDVIRDIWLRCGDLGPGPDFLFAANSVLMEASDTTEDWATTVREFTLWNWFTGARAQLAPAGIGHSERDSFPAFPDTMLDIRYDYPFTVLWNENPHSPQHNGATYLHLRDLQFIEYDTSFWMCNLLYDSTCTDSVEVIDPGVGYDFLRVDFVTGDTSYWNCFTWSDSVCGDSLRVTKNDPWDFLHFRQRIGAVDTSYWQCTELVDSRCVDSTQVDDLGGHDFVYIDSILDMRLALGTNTNVPPLLQPWGASFLFRFDDNPDSIEIFQMMIPDPSVIKLGFPNPHQYRSVTACFSPATYSNSTSYYRTSPRIWMDIGYVVEAQIEDSAYVNLPSAVMSPFPNPAVVSRMLNPKVTFRMQVETDSTGLPILTGDPYLVVDIYNVAGERVRTVTGYTNEPVRGRYELAWDLTNEQGKDVASGAYIAYARLYESDRKRELLAEDRVKVAVIR